MMSFLIMASSKSPWGTYIVSVMILLLLLQSWKERARTRAARPQEGGHQDAGGSRGDRPRRPGEHALPGLLQRQGQAEQRPAV